MPHATDPIPIPRSIAAEKVPMAAPLRLGAARSTTMAIMAGCMAAKARP